MTRSVGFTVALCLLAVRPAHAYIDPTAGGLLLQMLIAIPFGIALWFRDRLARLWKRFTGSKERAKR